jgi:hypothetical protein
LRRLSLVSEDLAADGLRGALGPRLDGAREGWCELSATTEDLAGECLRGVADSGLVLPVGIMRGVSILLKDLGIELW